jgi:hypothetical protein
MTVRTVYDYMSDPLAVVERLICNMVSSTLREEFSDPRVCLR